MKHSPEKLYCRCGGRYTNTNRAHHCETKKHVQYCMVNNFDVVELSHLTEKSRELLEIPYDITIHKK